VAASEAATAHTAEANNYKQKEASASADSPEPDALSDLFPGRQSCRISSPVAPVIPGSRWRKKGAANEPGHPISSKLLFRKSYRPERMLRIKPARIKVIFRPVRFGVKPEIKTYEPESY
jgi:hypothetical protein